MLKKMTNQKVYDLNRPWLSLDPWQEDYIFNTPPEQDCFLLCTRQGGKTTGMSIRSVELCVHHFKKGEVVLISSLTERQAQLMLMKALVYAEEKYFNKIAEGRDKPTMHRLFFKNGSGILCYAAGEEGDSTRGYTVKKLMIDEGSRMKETYFVSATPTLSVTKGSMDIASTPHGKFDKYGNETFFYKCSKDNHFKKFYVSASDCPRHDPEFLKKEEARMTKSEYAQEYLAVFLDDVLRYFDDEIIKAAMVLNKEEEISPRDNKIYLGVDVARYGEDQSAFVSLVKHKETMIQIQQEVTNKKRLTETAEKIKELNKKYLYSKIYIDTTGIGWGVFDILLEDDDTKRKIVAIENKKKSLDYNEDGDKKKLMKEDLYQNLKNLMEKGKLILFKDDELEASLTSIQYEKTEDSIRLFGSNTHLTEALARACWGSKDKSLNIYYA
jgi:hypothetical protein